VYGHSFGAHSREGVKPMLLQMLTKQRISRRRAIASGTAAAGAAALAAACGGRQTVGTRSTTGSGQPKAGGDYYGAISTDPANFDPTGKPLQLENASFLEAAYDALLAAKLGPDVKFNTAVIQPALADKWEIPDPQTYTFHLHPGVKWQNLPPVNGRAFTAADAKWSIEYQARIDQFKGSQYEGKTLPPSLNDSFYTGIDRIDTPDANTLVVHFSSPFAPFLNYMALPRSSLLAHEVFDKDGHFMNTLVGTGPWQLDVPATKPGSRWLMRKNPNYYQSGHPYIDRLNYLVLSDEATNIAGFKTKQVDLLNQIFVTPVTAPQIQKDNPNAVMYQYDNTSGGLLFENVRKAPLNDVRVRKAISLSIDRDAYSKTFYAGKGQPAVVGAGPGFFSADEVKQFTKYDPAQAKQLIAQAGYPNGLDIEMHFPGTDRGQSYISVIQWIQSQLKDANINVKLESFDSATFGKRQRSGDFQLDFEAKPVVGDIDGYVYYNWYSKSVGNFGGVADPKLDALLDAQRAEVDTKKRDAVLRQVAQYINDQAYYTAFSYGVGWYFWPPVLKNFAPNVARQAPPLNNAWVDRG
jgi:peptide/nickel transport system substrate-binding protein